MSEMEPAYIAIAEAAAKETVNDMENDGYLTDRSPYLPDFLQHVIHKSIQVGIGLAGLHDRQISGPGELLEAYAKGYQDCKEDMEKS